jgi:hypothetical protein
MINGAGKYRVKTGALEVTNLTQTPSAHEGAG